MKKDVVIGRIDSIERLTNSVNGNPRFRISMIDNDNVFHLGAWNTSADASLSYEIGNIGYRVGDSVVLIIGGRGTITHIKENP